MKCDSTTLEMAVVNSLFTKRQQDTTLNSAIYSGKSGHSSPGEKPDSPVKNRQSGVQISFNGGFPQGIPQNQTLIFFSKARFTLNKAKKANKVRHEDCRTNAIPDRQTVTASALSHLKIIVMGDLPEVLKNKQSPVYFRN